MWAAQVVKALGQDMVIFRADNGVGTVSSKVIGVHNPGTPESALIDMRLLSECNELIVTVGSSYGSVSAGWGGIPPVQMIHGLHKNVQVGSVRLPPISIRSAHLDTCYSLSYCRHRQGAPALS